VSGEIERVVSLAVLHLSRGDGRVFVHLAKWEKLQAVPDVKLPAIKCRGNEPSDEAMQRFLATELAPMATGIEVLAAERETDEQHSARFDVRTLYMRKLFYAKFTGSLSAPVLLEDSMVTNLASTRRLDRWSSTPIERWASRDSSTPSMEILESVPVHFVRRNAGGTFYAWLRECDLPHLTALNNNSAVRRWLQTFRPPDVSRV